MSAQFAPLRPPARHTSAAAYRPWAQLAPLLGLLLGCSRTPPAPALPPAPLAAAGACEVELGGRVQQEVTGNRSIAVYVSAGDCADPAAPIIERAVGSGDGQFFAEVWVPCGTTLTVCAAVEPRVPLDGQPKPTVRWAKLGRELRAVGTGEIEFFGLAWPLQDQAERTFAAPRPMLLSPQGHRPRVPE